MKLFAVGFLLCAAVGVGLAVLTDGRGHRLDDVTFREPQRVAADSSPADNDGIIQGSPVLGLPGHDGLAYSFDRRGSWVEVPSAAAINPGTRDFLFTAWVLFRRAPDKGDTYDIVRKGVSYTPTGEFKIEILYRGRVKCTVQDGGGHEYYVIATAQDVTDSAWHRIGCARTGDAWSVVVDGAVKSKTVELGSVSNDVPMSIGSKYGREDLPSGRVDDVVFALGREARGPVDPADVSGLVRALEQSRPSGWWRLDEAPMARRHAER